MTRQAQRADPITDQGGPSGQTSTSKSKVKDEAVDSLPLITACHARQLPIVTKNNDRR